MSSSSPQPPVTLAKWLADAFKAWEEKANRAWEEKTNRAWEEKWEEKTNKNTADLRNLVNANFDQQALVAEGLSERLARLEANQPPANNGQHLAIGWTLGGLALSAPLWGALYVTHAANAADGAKPKRLSKALPPASLTQWFLRMFK